MKSKIGPLGLVALVLFLITWRQYEKYLDGHGIATWLLPRGAPEWVVALIFIVIPLAALLSAARLIFSKESGVSDGPVP